MAPTVQVDEAGIDMLLVGDSVAMVVHGHDTTLPVSETGWRSVVGGWCAKPRMACARGTPKWLPGGRGRMCLSSLQCPAVNGTRLPGLALHKWARPWAWRHIPE